jgi:hypothetical protein
MSETIYLCNKVMTLNISQPYKLPRPVTGIALLYFNKMMIEVNAYGLLTDGWMIR